MTELQGSRNTFDLLRVKIAKAILLASLKCDASCSGDECELLSLSHFCLGCLYCFEKRYHKAIDHLLPVIKSGQTFSQATGVQTLLRTVDYANTVSGFIVFYNFVKTSTINSQKTDERVDALTADLTALFLLIVCWVKKRRNSKSSSALRTYVYCYRDRLKVSRHCSLVT
jgi:hypothetical protein